MQSLNVLALLHQVKVFFCSQLFCITMTSFLYQIKFFDGSSFFFFFFPRNQNNNNVINWNRLHKEKYSITTYDGSWCTLGYKPICLSYHMSYIPHFIISRLPGLIGLLIRMLKLVASIGEISLNLFASNLSRLKV